MRKPELAEARLAQARAQADNYQAEYTRAQKLFNEQLISQKDLATQELAYKSAQADVRTAQESLNSSKQGVKASEYAAKSVATDVKMARDSYNKTVLRAPMSGIISQLNVEKGERVVGTSQMQGTEMLRIANLSNMECRIEVSENEIVKVNIGDSCDIEVDAYYGDKFKGIVTQISNSTGGASALQGSAVDQVTNFEVTVTLLADSYSHLQDKQFPFRPGMSATVDVITARINDKLAVPVQAVIAKTPLQIAELEKDAKKNSDDDADEEETDTKSRLDGMSNQEKNEKSEYVFVLRNGKTMILPVKSGVQNDKYIIIEEGLTKGDTVITAPYDAISKSLKLEEVVEIVDEDNLYSD